MRTTIASALRSLLRNGGPMNAQARAEARDVLLLARDALAQHSACYMGPRCRACAAANRLLAGYDSAGRRVKG